MFGLLSRSLLVGSRISLVTLVLATGLLGVQLLSSHLNVAARLVLLLFLFSTRERRSAYRLEVHGLQGDYKGIESERGRVWICEEVERRSDSAFPFL